MKDILTTIFGLMSAIGTAGAGVCILQDFTNPCLIGFFAFMVAIGHAGHGYFTNKG
jgi:hypothetical protein